MDDVESSAESEIQNTKVPNTLKMLFRKLKTENRKP